MKRRLTSPFWLAMVALLVLAAWASLSAGIFDGAIAKQVRSSSVYVAPGVRVDQTAAEKIIGNRRLVVVFMAPGEDLASGCDDTSGAADGTLVLMLRAEGEDWDRYGCAHIPDAEDENFGKAYVAETTIASGLDQFVDRPLEALKVAVVNYDGLVKAGIVPDGARTISPSLPRYLLAVSAVVAVIAAAGVLWFVGRRAGRLAATHRSERDATQDARGSLNAKAAVLAGQIIELDRTMTKASQKVQKKYRAVAAEYADVVSALTDGKADGPDLVLRVESLTERARALKP